MTESILTLNCITDYTEGGSGLPIAFERALDALECEITQVISGFKLSGNLERIYIQFQYDCAKIPNTVRGTKISRYSKKYRDVQAYREVSKAEFTSVAQEARISLLRSAVIEILEKISANLSGKVESNIEELVVLLKQT